MQEFQIVYINSQDQNLNLFGVLTIKLLLKILKHLVTAPVLAFPKLFGLFILDTEATDFAIGAELDQVQNGDECAFACSSYILSPA